MFGKKKTKSNYYFDSFPALCHFSVQCAEYILNFMKVLFIISGIFFYLSALASLYRQRP